MAFTGNVITMAALLSIDLPGPRAIRLCDGGFLDWGGDRYASEDADFGAVLSVDAPEESLGDEAPGTTLTFLPNSATAGAILSKPEYQGASVKVYLAQIDPVAGTVTGTPESVFEGMIDTSLISYGLRSRTLEMGLISSAERLFTINEGNVLSDRFHKSVWPGEAGLANATGVPTPVAWGVAAPPRGSVSGGGYTGGGGGIIRGIEQAMDSQ